MLDYATIFVAFTFCYLSGMMLCFIVVVLFVCMVFMEGLSVVALVDGRPCGFTDLVASTMATQTHSLAVHGKERMVY